MFPETVKLVLMPLPKILNVEPIRTGSMFVIERVKLRFSNGVERSFERFTNRGRLAVMMIPFLDKDTILLVREYGTGIEQYHLSLPKGGLESHEAPEEAANRELQEEIGYGANKLTMMKEFTSSPSYSANKMSVVIAEDLYPCKREGDEPEPIEVVPWSIHKLDELFARPDVHEARAIAALMMLARQRSIW